jgi:hypothetical protein
MTAEVPSPEVLLRACAAFGRLVAAEYPEGLTLTRIAWMRSDDPFMELSDEDLAAIEAVESCLAGVPAGWDLTAWAAEAVYSPPGDEGPVAGDGKEQALVHEHLDGLPDGADGEPGLADDLGDGRDAAAGRVGPVLDAGADDAR